MKPQTHILKVTWYYNFMNHNTILFDTSVIKYITLIWHMPYHFSLQYRSHKSNYCMSYTGESNNNTKSLSLRAFYFFSFVVPHGLLVLPWTFHFLEHFLFFAMYTALFVNTNYICKWNGLVLGLVRLYSVCLWAYLCTFKNKLAFRIISFN